MPKIQEARLRHALHYGEQLQRAQALFLQRGPATAEGLALFDMDAANIRAAHQWSIDESGTDPAAKVLSTLFPLPADIQKARLTPSWRIETLRHAVRTCADLGDSNQLVLHGSNLAIALVDAGHLAKALEMYDQSLAHFRKVGDRKNESIALGNMADICRSLGNLEGARECVEQLLALAREDQDVQAEAVAVNSLGSLRAVVNDRDGAIRHFRQALGDFERMGNRRFELAVLCNLCDALAGSGDAGRAEARVYLERALGLARELGDRRAEVSLLDQAAGLLARAEPERALEIARASIEMAERSLDRIGMASLLNSTGHYQAIAGNTELAIEAFTTAIEGFRGTGLCFEEARTRRNLGGVYERLGQHSEAAEQFARAEQVFRDLENRPLCLDMCRRLSESFETQGNVASAVTWQERAVTESAEMGDPAQLGDQLTRLGMIWRRADEPTKARKPLEEARDAYRRAGSLKGEVLIAYKLGCLQSDLGDRATAAGFFQDVLRHAPGAGDLLHEALALWRVAVIHAADGNLTESVVHYRRAAEVSRRGEHHETEAQILADFALARLRSQEYSEADGPLDRAASLFATLGMHQEAANQLVNRSIALVELKRAAEAAELCRRAYEHFGLAGDLGRQGNALLNLGNALASHGDSESAVEQYLAARATFRAAGNRHMEAAALSNLGLFYRRTGRPQPAVGLHQEAAAILEADGRHGRVAGELLNIALDYEALHDTSNLVRNAVRALSLARRFAPERVPTITQLLDRATVVSDADARDLARPES
jgi:tetratricopeptide (TPR) repeat protein